MEELIKEIEELKIEDREMSEYNYGYNDAIRSVINIIKNFDK